MKRDSLQRGQGLVEFALIVALLGGVVTLSLAMMGVSVRDVYCDVLSGMGNDVCSFVPESWTTTRGKWSEGEPLCNEKLGEGRTFADDFSGDDYVINIDSAQLSQGNGYGLFFRATDVDGKLNGYTFQYDPGFGKGAFIMRKWVNGYELPPIAVNKVPDFPWHGSDNKIRLEVVGNTFKAYVNGELVLTAQDDTYSEGGFGLRTWDSTRACFSGISITSP